MQPKNKIATLKDFQPAGLEVFVNSARRGMRRTSSSPKKTLAAPVINAEINAGRWIARCPFCSGAELVDLEDLRFFCLSCHNEDVGGQWLTVEIPEQREQIETELLKRPKDENRNWLSGETIAKLKQENKDHGVVS